MPSNIPVPQQIYRHFKGNLYQIITTAQHTETGEILVIYQALYGDFSIYARPLDMFLGKVDQEKYPEAVQKYRFELKGPSQPAQETTTAAQAAAAQTAQTLQGGQTSQEPETSQEPDLDPLVLEFLDSDSYEQRLNILAALHHRITDDMITTMAIASDIEVSGNNLEERFEGLKRCLLTLEKYECNRLR